MENRQIPFIKIQMSFLRSSCKLSLLYSFHSLNPVILYLAEFRVTGSVVSAFTFLMESPLIHRIATLQSFSVEESANPRISLLFTVSRLTSPLALLFEKLLRFELRDLLSCSERAAFRGPSWLIRWGKPFESWIGSPREGSRSRGSHESDHPRKGPEDVDHTNRITQRRVPESWITRIGSPKEGSRRRGSHESDHPRKGREDVDHTNRITQPRSEALGLDETSCEMKGSNSVSVWCKFWRKRVWTPLPPFLPLLKLSRCLFSWDPVSPSLHKTCCSDEYRVLRQHDLPERQFPAGNPTEVSMLSPADQSAFAQTWRWHEIQRDIKSLDLMDLKINRRRGLNEIEDIVILIKERLFCLFQRKRRSFFNSFPSQNEQSQKLRFGAKQTGDKKWGFRFKYKTTDRK